MVIVTETGIQVVTVALQGPAGPAGSGGTPELVSVSFAFGDAPRVVYTAPMAGRIVRASLSYRTALNTSAIVLVGVVNGGGSIVAATDSDPSTVASYDVSPDLSFAPGAQIWLTITPSGSVTGAGILTLFVSF